MSGQGHVCPTCGRERVPYWQAVCRRCWRELPEAIRRPLLHAWQRRLIEPVAYSEALIAALLWGREMWTSTTAG